MTKSYSTIEAIGAKLDELVEEAETWDEPTADDVRRMNMVQSLLRDRAALIRCYDHEAKLARLEEIVKAKFQPELRRIG